MSTVHSVEEARDRFLRTFPRGFEDPEYLRRERSYKLKAHQSWCEQLDKHSYRSLLEASDYGELLRRLLRAERSLNLLFPQEKAALKDGLTGRDGVQRAGIGLYSLLHGMGTLEERFTTFASFMDSLDQPGTPIRWPAVTILPFIAQPGTHLFLKPEVTKALAAACNIELNYKSQPNWLTYSCLLRLGDHLRKQLADLHPRDNIDIQSFIWVTGNPNYQRGVDSDGPRRAAGSTASTGAHR